jgi:phosphopantetheine--protein transferase-like protein
MQKNKEELKDYLHIYICPLPSEAFIGEVYPESRNREIQDTKNERVRREKYYVWKLLEYAIEESTKKSIRDFSFSKLETGKWIADGTYFSLSHSNDALAVAVSSRPVGVDIELINTPRAEGFARRILSDSEFLDFETLPENERLAFLIKKWTEKESLFKLSSDKAFVPSEISANEKITLTGTVEILNREYSYSVSSEALEKAKIIIINELKKK